MDRAHCTLPTAVRLFRSRNDEPSSDIHLQAKEKGDKKLRWNSSCWFKEEPAMILPKKRAKISFLFFYNFLKRPNP